MKEAAEVTASILFLIATWAFRVAWGIIKIAIFFAILWGAVKNLSTTSLPVVGSVVSWAQTTTPSFFGATFLSWVSDNWMALAVLLIFLNSVTSRRDLDDLSKTGGYTRIFIGTVMNYFGIQTEVPFGQRMREVGMWASMKERFSENFFQRSSAWKRQIKD